MFQLTDAPLRGLAMVVFVFLSLALTSSATTVKPLDDDALYASAQRVFQGVCTEVRGELDANGRIVMRLSLLGHRGLQGRARHVGRPPQPGGTFAGRTRRTVGTTTN